MVSDASTVFSSSTRLKLEQMSLTPLQASSFALRLCLQEMHALQELYLLSITGKYHSLAQTHGTCCTAGQTVSMQQCCNVSSIRQCICGLAAQHSRFRHCTLFQLLACCSLHNKLSRLDLSVDSGWGYEGVVLQQCWCGL